MVMSLGFSSSSMHQQKQALAKQRYNEIYAHELKHKNAAGSFGGSIVIEKDANGIPTGGHVDILMPVLDKNNPDKTIKHADTVIKAAMAPHDPSSQDYKVAAEAKSIKAEAQRCSKQGCGQNLNVVV
ncbi:MAG: hypothetical protein IJY61_08880 [Candidatus Gastranaerophilales bacterium]|nr:hypothetical protein [Candidatus Gastranaerophilales bacterium]